MQDILVHIRNGTFPDHAKSALVQGMLPLDTEVLIAAMCLLCGQDEQLIETAKVTFSELPDGVKQPVFEARDIDPLILDFSLKHFALPLEAKQAAILNPQVLGSTLRDIAANLEIEFLDLAVNNQVKILEEPQMISALLENPGLSIIHKQKLEEYGRLLLKDLVSPAEELEELPIEDVEKAAIQEAKEFVKTFGKESPTAAREDRDDLPEEEVELERESVLKRVQRMTIPQKVQAAIKGDREIRGILIRESNKLVCCAVVKSPKITESEIEFYSNLRNIQADVLRLIALNREWIKSYSIVHNLVKNPRTPLAFSMKLLHRLNKKDLQFLMRDRNVPEVLRTTVRRMLRTKAKR